MTSRLRLLLGPYLTPGMELADIGWFRFHDAPPAVVRQALALLDPTWTTGRPNGQPPAGWLLDTAESLNGALAGAGNERGSLRVDAICVEAESGAELARAVEAAWPEIVFDGTALDHAVAEAWSGWDAESAFWTGGGRDLLDRPTLPGVVGLWWD